MNNLKDIDFKSLASKQKTIQMKTRLLALSHFQDGKSRTDIARYLKVSRTSVNKWVSIYLSEGLAGLEEKPRTGRPPFINTQQINQLVAYIETRASSEQGGRLTGADIHHFIQTTFGKSYHPDSIYYLLNKIGFSWITSRSKHPKQSEALQDDFKKNQN